MYVVTLRVRYCPDLVWLAPYVQRYIISLRYNLVFIFISIYVLLFYSFKYCMFIKILFLYVARVRFSLRRDPYCHTCQLHHFSLWNSLSIIYKSIFHKLSVIWLTLIFKKILLFRIYLFCLFTSESLFSILLFLIESI